MKSLGLSKYIISFLVFVNLLAFLRMFVPEIRLGLITSSFLVILLSVASIKIKSVRILDNAPFLLILFVQVISLTYYVVNPKTASFISQSPLIVFTFISYLLIPQIGFFMIGAILSRDEENLIKAYKIIGRIHFFTFFTGIILFFWRPNFYLNYLYVVQSKFYETETWFYPRLVSYLDTSMILGIIGTFSFVLIYYFESKRRWKIVMLITILIGVIMTLSRGAWVSLGISILLIILKELISLNFRSLTLSIVVLLSIGFIISLFAEESTILIDLMSRFGKMGSSIEERSYQWAQILDQLTVYPMGFGLGLTSHKAIGFEYMVPDGNFFRIMGDTGILGIITYMLFFSYSIYLASIRSFPLLIILIAFYFQAIGTNVFDLYYAGYFFWFFLGVAYNTPQKQ